MRETHPSGGRARVRAPGAEHRIRRVALVRLDAGCARKSGEVPVETVNGLPKVRWACWIDGSRGQAISGTLETDHAKYQLAAHIGAPRRKPKEAMQSHQAMRLIRAELR